VENRPPTETETGEAASFPGKRAAAPFRPPKSCCPLTSAKLFIGFNQENLWTRKECANCPIGPTS
jgi:hypothetical protein